MPPRLILVLVADQLNAAHTGFGGLGPGYTPNLDALAARGMRFDRVHATNPVCMPSRASMATGMWPSTHGTRTNGIPLDPTNVTIQGALRRAGWNTAAVGKLHYQPMGWDFSPEQQAEIDASDPQATDPNTVDAVERSGPLTSWSWESMSTHADAYVAMPDDYYGFADVDLVLNHGDGCSGHYRHWVRERGVDLEELAGYARSSAASATWAEVWRSEVPARLSSTAFVVEHAGRRIERAAADDTPTFLFVSFPDPHHPFCPPAEYHDRFDPAEVVLPRTFGADHAGLPPHIAHMHARRGNPHPDSTFTWAVNEHQHREAMAAQLGLIAMLDDGIGTILGAVDAAGLADDTLTVFTADHGELGGEHGLWLKHYVHYPALTRVPMVVAGDGVEVGATDALASNADIVPTLLDRSGVEYWRGIQGRTLEPVLRGDGGGGRRAVLVEEDQPIGVSGLPGPARMRTVVTNEGRYTSYQGQPFGELYDHGDDPDELVNRFDDAIDLRRRMAEILFDEVLSVSDQRRRIEAGA